MTISQNVIGIDVSKNTLDIFDSAGGRAQQVGNCPITLKPLIDDWHRHKCRVIFEATGIYDRYLRRLLSDAKVSYCRVDPTRARHFAHAAGFLAKTDRVDARMLARMGQSLKLADSQEATVERQRLHALGLRREQLVAMRAQEKTRLKGLVEDNLAASIICHIEFLSTEITALQRQIGRHIQQNDGLAEQAKRLASVPGIGPVAVATLLADLPELGHRSAKIIAALAGLAPLNRDSGKVKGLRRITKGRARVKRALYIAALTGLRSNQKQKHFYEKLISTGKPPKVALIAVARKIIVTLNAMERDKNAFQN
jgi:transposase